MPTQKILVWLLIAGCLACLAQIWVPHYYLTGDGPCHLYNARVLHDMWNQRNLPFYNHFYSIVYQPNPNWLSHILLSLPMFLFSGVIAEKIFLTLYAGLMISGCYLLLKKVAGRPGYWALVIFLLVFNHSLAKGFYNFSLATAFYLWMVLCWLLFLEKRSNKHAILFFCFTALIFFTQLLPFVFGLITCFALTVSYALSKENTTPRKPLLFFLKHAITLSIFTAPFLFLMLWFITKEHGLDLKLHHHFYRFQELVSLKYLITASASEAYFTALAGVTTIAILITALVYRFKQGFGVNKYDGFLYSLAAVMFVYLFFPEAFLSRVILISMRAQLFVVILALLSIAYILPDSIRNAGGGLLYICFLGLTIVRFPLLIKASEGCADYNSVAAYIRPNSVVLPLDFAPEGKDATGKTIASRNYLFTHALHYSGTQQPLVFLDNYEAFAGYFPLLWRYNANPYQHLAKWEGIEAQPPAADIHAYENSAGVTIDYIVMWCYDSSFLHKGHYAELNEQIKAGYHTIYSSPTKRTILLQRN